MAAINMHGKLRGKIGCAYYDPVPGKLYILEDTADSSYFDLLKMGESMLSMRFSKAAAAE